MEKNKLETIIIGAGIAGLSAAIYASRKRMDYKIIAPNFGGQFLVSGEILNYPGIVETTGAELSATMKKQIEVNGIEITEGIVQSVEKEGSDFKVITNKREYLTKTIIITTGSKPRKLNIPGEEEFARKGVTYCAVCDGPLFADKEVAVIGGGNSAMEAVDFMKKIASKVYLIVRGRELAGHEYLMERVINNSKVEILYQAETKEILGDKMVSGIKFNQNGKDREIEVQGVVIEIGRIPNVEPFKDLVELDESGHIKIDCQMQTNISGIFAAGDVASGHEYQYIISAGQGCMALLKAVRYLAGRE